MCCVTCHQEKMNAFVSAAAPTWSLRFKTRGKKTDLAYCAWAEMDCQVNLGVRCAFIPALNVLIPDSRWNAGSDELPHQSLCCRCFHSYQFTAALFSSCLPYHHLQPFQLSAGRHSWSAADLVELVNNNSHLSPSTLITAQCLFLYL